MLSVTLSLHVLPRCSYEMEIYEKPLLYGKYFFLLYPILSISTVPLSPMQKKKGFPLKQNQGEKQFCLFFFSFICYFLFLPYFFLLKSFSILSDFGNQLLTGTYKKKEKERSSEKKKKKKTLESEFQSRYILLSRAICGFSHARSFYNGAYRARRFVTPLDQQRKRRYLNIHCLIHQHVFEYMRSLLATHRYTHDITYLEETEKSRSFAIRHARGVT